MGRGKNHVENFWAEFEDAVLGSGVPKPTAGWYVTNANWVRRN